MKEWWALLLLVCAPSRAGDLCTLQTANLDAEVSRIVPRIRERCPKCSAEVLKAFVRRYHPAFADGAKAVTAIHVSPVPDLGSEEDWNGVRLGSGTLERSVFGDLRCPAPVARFSKGPFALTFLAASHESYLAPTDSERQRRMIQDEFDAARPGAVVVEGFPTELPCSAAEESLLHPRSEADYLVHLALLKGIPIYGGDNPNVSLANATDWQGLMLLYLMGVPANQKGSLEQTFKQVHSTSLSMTSGKGGLHDFATFRKWYLAKNGREPTLESLADDITPSAYLRDSGKTPLGTNAIADESTLARDRQVTRTVREALLRHTRVFMVFGRSHLTAELPVYERHFGKLGAPGALCARARPADAAEKPCM